MAEPQDLFIEVRNLRKHFRSATGVSGRSGPVVKAVNDVSFGIRRGETLGLVGESGSGKSTTGRLMLRLIEPDAGQCFVGGSDIYHLSSAEMRRERRRMQIVFQDPYGAFNPRMTVSRIIGEGLDLRGIRSPRDRDAEVSRLLQLVHLPPEMRTRFPHEFSGGQRQRIGIARALAVEPEFVVADEPVSALDVSTQAEIINLFLDLQQRLSLTMLFISHDLSVVRVLADQVAVMFAGKILEIAPTLSLFDRPLQPYTQELLAAIPDPSPGAQRPAPAPQNDVPEDDARTGSNGCPFAGRCPHTMDICRSAMPALVDYAPAIGQGAGHLAACHWTALQLAPARSDAQQFRK